MGGQASGGGPVGLPVQFFVSVPQLLKTGYTAPIAAPERRPAMKGPRGRTASMLTGREAGETPGQNFVGPPIVRSAPKGYKRR